VDGRPRPALPGPDPQPSDVEVLVTSLLGGGFGTRDADASHCATPDLERP
jgi:hypothetical protein